MAATRICFVSPDSYQVLNPACNRPHGGAEVQMLLLARSFRERGYEVHMVALDHGQPDGELIDDLRVWRAYPRDGGMPVIRFIHPRATGLLRALARADADIYVQSCAGMATGLTSWYCRRRGAAFVYRVAHDTDCVPGGQRIQYARDRKLYEYGLRRADVVIAQSRHQQELLARNYGVQSDVGGSVVEMWPQNNGPADRSIDVLWVGSIRPAKRPELVLRLAEQRQDRSVCIVGGPEARDGGLYHELAGKAASLDNVDWRGFQPYHATRSMFSRAKVLFSTSETEGFPNTYLQGWMAGTPVVAFFDPDGLIAREGLGFVIGSFDEGVEAVERLLSAPDLWREYSSRARAYALKNHGESVIDRYESLMAPLSNRRAA